MDIFRLENLNITLWGKKILEQISLQVPSNSLIAILAPNGSGKTTLMQSILGMHAISSGAIYFNEKNFLSLNYLEKSKILAFVPQEFYCAFDYSVLDFVMLGGINQVSFLGHENKELQHKAKKILEELGILDLAMRGVFTLSGGQKQMLLLARALFQESRVLLLDEPTAWLDLKNQFIFFKVLKEQIKKRGLCVLMNIHDPNLVCLYADGVVFLKNGKKIYEGSVEDGIKSTTLSLLYDMPIEVLRLEDRILVTY